jgi:lipid-binding SYLF domain-containing protein
MNKTRTSIAIIILVLATLLPSLTHAAGANEIDRAVRQAARQLYSNNAEAWALAKQAEAVLIFPDIVKAGFIFGGSFGEGALLEDFHIIGYYSTVAASYGFQAGVEQYGYALFFMDDEALSYLKRSRGWAIGTGPSVTILDKGFTKSISTTSLQKGVYAIFFNQQGLRLAPLLKVQKSPASFPDKAFPGTRPS